MSTNVEKFIEKNWDRCIRENRLDDGELIGLPYPYSTPNDGCFDCIYYWDTYFTNVGLLLDGRHAQAKNNVDVMLYLINKYGFMPNGNKTFFLVNSQPPFLSEMVKDIYNFYKDPVWLLSAYRIIEKEYDFFMTQRMSPIGLNVYGSNYMDEQRIKDVADMYKSRTGNLFTNDEGEIARHTIAICESGWDTNPRWEDGSYNYVTVDLNSLLYGVETNMAYFSKELGLDGKIWKDRASKRKELMLEYLTNEEGILTDFNFVTKKHSPVFSAASLYPLYAKMMGDDYAKIIYKNIGRIKGKYGIFACEKNDIPGAFQWDYPNGWPPHQYMAIKIFDEFGYKDLAKEIAMEYIEVIDSSFETTQNLWEKYNVEEGTSNTKQELCKVGKLPDMMGWTAGVYLYSRHYINNIA